MDNVVIDEKYTFVPPYRGTFWTRLISMINPYYLNRKFGILDVRLQGWEKIQASMQQGHGVMLNANHSRPADPFIMGVLASKLNTYFYTMASWHVFKQDWFSSFIVRRSGAFSVYREGIDRTAIKTAIDALVEGERPLLIFPEGVITRSNDKLEPLMDGPALIARSAAKKLAESSSEKKVVVHPVFIRYSFDGDLVKTLEPVLTRMENRLTWPAQAQLPTNERIVKLGKALLTLKEFEFMGNSQSGEMADRLINLIDHILAPVEDEWIKKKSSAHTVVGRVKKIRSAILSGIVKGEVDATERQRRWKQLENVYLAQQLSHYSPGYIFESDCPERKLETVERFEEDLTDVATIHRPMSATIIVGDAIVVPAQKVPGVDDVPLMEQVEQKLKALINGKR